MRASSPKDALDKLEELGFKEVILSGGSKLNTAFAKDHFINEVILNVESIIIGEGIPLFHFENFDLKLNFNQ